MSFPFVKAGSHYIVVSAAGLARSRHLKNFEYFKCQLTILNLKLIERRRAIHGRVIEVVGRQCDIPLMDAVLNN